MVRLGLEYMGIGMSVVFAFLVLMVVVMYCSAAILTKLAKYFPEEAAVVSKPSVKTDNKERIAAAIAIAVASTK